MKGMKEMKGVKESLSLSSPSPLSPLSASV